MDALYKEILKRKEVNEQFIDLVIKQRAERLEFLKENNMEHLEKKELADLLQDLYECIEFLASYNESKDN